MAVQRGVDFHERMTEIHAELAQLNSEANVLMDEIQKAWRTEKTKHEERKWPSMRNGKDRA